MPLSFQTHKSNQEISQIIDNLNVNKNGNLSTNSGEKTGDEIVTAKDVRLMKRFYLTKEKGYTTKRTEIEGISETDRTWNFEQIFPTNFKIKKVIQMKYVTTASSQTNSQFTYKTVSGTVKNGFIAENASSRGVVLDISNDIYYSSIGIRLSTGTATIYNCDSGGTMDTVTKVVYTDVSLPESEKQKFILAVEGYFE